MLWIDGYVWWTAGWKNGAWAEKTEDWLLDVKKGWVPLAPCLLYVLLKPQIWNMYWSVRIFMNDNLRFHSAATNAHFSLLFANWIIRNLLPEFFLLTEFSRGLWLNLMLSPKKGNSRNRLCGISLNRNGGRRAVLWDALEWKWLALATIDYSAWNLKVVKDEPGFWYFYCFVGLFFGILTPGAYRTFWLKFTKLYEIPLIKGLIGGWKYQSSTQRSTRYILEHRLFNNPSK